MKKIPETKIGNFLVAEPQTTVAHLHCFCAEGAQLNVDILNEQGKSYRTHKASLTSGPHKVAIRLGQLPPGHYNAWVTLGQVSGIRSFIIPPNGSIKDRMKKWFKR
ncbi:MAG: hypothetical protein RIC19_25030 [Phaeodactylibacter sp.]|uniref:hypothetical protein n=1 Tax=Phaeodactylibacter sp. TaxID=1940289 RepID=UPI0032EC93CC